MWPRLRFPCPLPVAIVNGWSIFHPLPVSFVTIIHPVHVDSQRLAIHGGAAVFPEGAPTWPPVEEDILNVFRAIWSDGSWARYQAEHLETLEQQLMRQFKTPYVVLTCSGTVAVELALRGLKVGPGDEVILAGYDFPGNFRAIEAVGAIPVLTDVVAGGWSLDACLLEAAWGPKVRAVVVSHLHGELAPMRDICRWAADRGVRVVEDACQTPGGLVQGQAAGAWGDAGVISFGGSKLLTAGRGGAVLTHDAQVRQRIRIFSQRGNEAFPLSEMQAAVLLPQLEKLAPRNQRRQQAVSRLVERLAGVSGLMPGKIDGGLGVASYYKFGWLLDPKTISEHGRTEFLAALQAEGVAMGEGFRGFVRRGNRRCRKVGTLPASHIAAERTVLLHHPVLLQGPEAMDRVAWAIEKVLSAMNKG
ncbi:MAG: aminotransferase class V-fold PLP-dependent enzyme [Planctomycetaceae bacterium]|nr:MAG: aminotransferase class V-fold PLP-dependent enzyme [Planctomycetaceae bacterium]